MKVFSALMVGLVAFASSSEAQPAWHSLSITAPEFGRYLHRTESGEPFFWQADTAWELTHRLNKTSIDFYLRTRAEQGYNVVQTVVISELNGTTRANFYGDLPFNNSDTSAPNEAYFELIDWTAELAASYGIMLALVPTWGMYVNGGWHTTTPIFNETNAREWGNFIGSRYPGLPKILGGDSNAIWTRNMSEVQAYWGANPSADLVEVMAPLEDTSSVWASMRKGLKEAESALGYESVVLYHPAGGWIVRPENTPKAYGHNMLSNEEDRVSINAVQSGHTTPDPTGTPFTIAEGWDSTQNYENIYEMRDGFTGPVLDLENHYEGAHYGFDPSRPIWNSSEVRNGLYHGVYSGSAGFTYGAQSVWQMYEPEEDLVDPSDYIVPQINLNASSSWRRDINYEGAWQIQYVTKPLQGLPINALEQLEPARDLLSSPSGSNGTSVKSFVGTRYISVLASSARDRYYVYAAHGDAFSLDLGCGSASRGGSYSWFNPRDGEYYNTTAVSVPGADGSSRVDFYPPTSGGVDHDWLLVAELS